PLVAEKESDQRPVKHGKQKPGRRLGRKLARAKSFFLGPRDKVHQERPVTVVKPEYLAGQSLGGILVVKQLRHEKPDRTRIVAYENIQSDSFAVSSGCSKS